MLESRTVRRLQHSSKAICPELPQQLFHKCDQSSTQSCGDSVFSDERPSVKMKLVNIWNSKLQTQGVCTSTRYGESKKVSVAIGFGICYVKVDDKGSGVSRDGLVLMGERYGQGENESS